MADTRHLRKRHQTYYFELAVPRKLRAAYGRKKVLLSLKTQDLAKAQELRWALKVKFQNEFSHVSKLHNRPLGEAEIEEFAQAIYRKTLVDLQADASKKGLRERVPYHEGSDEEVDPEVQELEGAMWAVQDALEDEDYSSVAAEILSVERQTGQQVSSNSNTYRLLARAILHARHSAFAGRIKALNGLPSEAPGSFIGTASVDPITLRLNSRAETPGTNGGVRFSEACSRYVADLDRDPSCRLSKQTMAQMAAVHRLFLGWSRDAPIASISRALASDFLDKIATLHPLWGRSPRTKHSHSSKWSRSSAGVTQC